MEYVRSQSTSSDPASSPPGVWLCDQSAKFSTGLVCGLCSCLKCFSSRAHYAKMGCGKVRGCFLTAGVIKESLIRLSFFAPVVSANRGRY
ncbi:hypothetical protein SDJN02_12993, partial [Cucurbita argyrosperma subsp. argyrosperma]